ncbi:MAG: TraR/DksA family transcriptional regulator [Leptospiraceae bacterium]|mgnify:CR=1 FL=1|nr:TraR/DksA family transcriptional regulator [Leptospiraceae bacterium]
MAKTPFSTKELNEFKEQLLEKKAHLIKEIQGKEEELTSGDKDEVGDMADLATELIERELNMSISESDRSRLEEINAALARIKDKSYGICVDTGEVINKARLKAVPEALRTLAAQEVYDRAQRKRKSLNRVADID